MKNFIAIDFETANFQTTSICSVGMVFVENQKIINTLYSLIRPNPNYYIERFSEIHGILYEDTQNAVTFDAFWAQTLPLMVAMMT